MLKRPFPVSIHWLPPEFCRLALLLLVACACGGTSGGNGADGGTTQDGGGSGSDAGGRIVVTNARAFSGANFNTPGELAIDGVGNIWVANVNVSGVTEVTPSVATTDCDAGCTAWTSSANGIGGLLGNLGGIAVDGANNVWIPRATIFMEISAAGVVQEVYPPSTGTDALNETNAIAVSGDGSLWLGGYNLDQLSASATLLSPAAGYGVPNMNALGVAIDASGNVWAATLEPPSNSGVVLEFPAGSPGSPKVFDGGVASPVAVAVDGHGNVWVVNNNAGFGAGASTVTEIPNGTATTCAGCTTYSENDLSQAEGLAVDGANNVWVAGGLAGTVVRIQPGASANCASGCTTYVTAQGLSHPHGVAIDASSNVWITDYDASVLVELPGIATATINPLVKQPR